MKTPPRLFHPVVPWTLGLVILAFFFPIHAAMPPPVRTIPLAEAAKNASKSLGKGVIVTAERDGGAVQHAIAGHPDPTGIPPEKILFEIGSITKVFTGLLLAQAVLENKVRLDTSLGEILGKELPWADPRVPRITLRQLATHGSGLPRLPANLEESSNLENPYARFDRQKLESALATVKLTATPPAPYDYSNFGFGLLGDLLSYRYGKPWDQLIAEKITLPLGMQDTCMVPTTSQASRLAPPFNQDKPEHSWTFQSLAGAGALRSTAADLFLFGQALLNPESSPLCAAIKLLIQPQTTEGDVGLGIQISKIDGRLSYAHGGGTGGYRTLFQVTPSLNRVQVILINNAALEPQTILNATRVEQPRSHDAGKTLTPEQLAAFQGLYGASKPQFTVLCHGDHLLCQLTGQAFLRIHPHERDDRFFYKEVPAELQFSRDDRQQINALTLFQNGREIRFPKTDAALPSITFRTSAELQPYAGTYALGPNAIFTLRVRGSTLFAQLSGQPFAPVFEKRPDWFEYDIVDAALEFERNAEGDIIALKLHQNGLIQRAVKK